MIIIAHYACQTMAVLAVRDNNNMNPGSFGWTVNHRCMLEGVTMAPLVHNS